MKNTRFPKICHLHQHAEIGYRVCLDASGAGAGLEGQHGRRALKIHAHCARCLRIRATDSSRQAVPRRVRNALWFRSAAIPRSVPPAARSRRISPRSPARPGPVPHAARPLGAEGDVAHAPARATLVPECVAGALTDGFPLPLRDCRHDGRRRPSPVRRFPPTTGCRGVADNSGCECKDISSRAAKTILTKMFWRSHRKVYSTPAARSITFPVVGSRQDREC